jgi:hypothetical protein
MSHKKSCETRARVHLNKAWASKNEEADKNHILVDSASNTKIASSFLLVLSSKVVPVCACLVGFLLKLMEKPQQKSYYGDPNYSLKPKATKGI